MNLFSCHFVCFVGNLKTLAVAFFVLSSSNLIYAHGIENRCLSFSLLLCRGRLPPHIHVERDDLEAKFWLDPLQLARNYGFAPHEINQITLLVFENQALLLNKYNEYHRFK
jgi:hypothetical protein